MSPTACRFGIAGCRPNLHEFEITFRHTFQTLFNLGFVLNHRHHRSAYRQFQTGRRKDTHICLIHPKHFAYHISSAQVITCHRTKCEFTNPLTEIPRPYRWTSPYIIISNPIMTLDMATVTNSVKSSVNNRFVSFSGTSQSRRRMLLATGEP